MKKLGVKSSLNHEDLYLMAVSEIHLDGQQEKAY